MILLFLVLAIMMVFAMRRLIVAALVIGALCVAVGLAIESAEAFAAGIPHIGSSILHNMAGLAVSSVVAAVVVLMRAARTPEARLWWGAAQLRAARVTVSTGTLAAAAGVQPARASQWIVARRQRLAL